MTRIATIFVIGLAGPVFAQSSPAAGNSGQSAAPTTQTEQSGGTGTTLKTGANPGPDSNTPTNAANGKDSVTTGTTGAMSDGSNEGTMSGPGGARGTGP